ncbi:MAG: hypothetical protein ABIQ95_08275 [Bdellovibrionia bacterium]
MKNRVITFAVLSCVSIQGFAAVGVNRGMKATHAIIYQENHKASAAVLIQGTEAVELRTCSNQTVPDLPIDARAIEEHISKYCASPMFSPEYGTKIFFQKDDNRFVAPSAAVIPTTLPPATCFIEDPAGKDCSTYAPAVVSQAMTVTVNLGDLDSLTLTNLMIFQRVGENTMSRSRNFTWQKYADAVINYPEIQNKAIVQ